MKIGIIGSGNRNSGLARRITLAGYDVLMTVRDLAEAEKTAKQIEPRVKVLPAADVAKGVDILIAATPSGEQVNALKSCGPQRQGRHRHCQPDQTRHVGIERRVYNDAEPLANARYLKPMGMLNIWFGYMAKRTQYGHRSESGQAVPGQGQGNPRA